MPIWRLKSCKKWRAASASRSTSYSPHFFKTEQASRRSVEGRFVFIEQRRKHMKCPNCGFESPPEMRFCGMCGTSLTRTCPNCEFVNPHTYRFCGMCGTPLQEEPGQAVTPARTTLTPPVSVSAAPAPSAHAPAAQVQSVQQRALAVIP